MDVFQCLNEFIELIFRKLQITGTYHIENTDHPWLEHATTYVTDKTVSLKQTRMEIVKKNRNGILIPFDPPIVKFVVQDLADHHR